MALGKGLSSLLPQQNIRKIIRKETGIINGGGQKVWEIPILEITPNPEQPRKEFSHSELNDLVSSIKQHGILQPLVVSEKDDGGYELIVGERRFRASQIAGLATIPALVRSVTQQEKLELALIENIQRQDLNPIEEAFAYARLLDEFNLTQEEVAKQVGKGRSSVANIVRLLSLPEKVQRALIQGKISVGKAKALLSLNNEKDLNEIFESMLGEKLTVQDVQKSIASKGQKSRKGSVRRDPNLLASEQLLEERLGTKVHISQRGGKGKIEIQYYSKEEFQRLMSELS